MNLQAIQTSSIGAILQVVAIQESLKQVVTLNISLSVLFDQILYLTNQKSNDIVFCE